MPRACPRWVVVPVVCLALMACESTTLTEPEFQPVALQATETEAATSAGLSSALATGEPKSSADRVRIIGFGTFETRDRTVTGQYLLHDAGKTLLRLEGGRVECDGERPVALIFVGTAETIEGDGTRTMSSFTARVSQSEASGVLTDEEQATIQIHGEIEECLIFDLTSSGVSQTIESQGRLVFDADACNAG